MKITKIGRQKKSSRLNIYVDKKYSFSLTESQVLEHGIKKDKELSDKNVDRLKKLSDEGKIYERLLAKAYRRPHSKKELIDYLYGKVDNKTIASFIDKLEELNIINDAKFAQSWVEDRKSRLKRSHRQLRLELYKKGVDKEIIESVLGGSEVGVLKELVLKKRKNPRYMDDQKLLAYLARKGFNYQDIKQAMKQE